MNKRNYNALAISDGACNPRAIVSSMTQALLEMGDSDTPTLCNDPALKLMVHQLAFLLNIPNNMHSYSKTDNKLGMDYRELMEHLKDKDPSYYYTDILIPNGLTLQNFIDQM